MIRPFAPAFLLALAMPAVAAAPTQPGTVRVRLETSKGPITIALETKKAPITAGNFLRYVDDRRLDGTTFYRAARTTNAPKYGFIQGGISHSYTRMLNPIPHEPTSKTGIHHVDGTISMARDAPGTATGDFFITVGAAPAMDASKGDPGFAAFGHVVAGMDTVHRILAAPTVKQTGIGDMKGQMLTTPVTITSAHRVN